MSNFDPALDVRPWYLATPYTNYPEGLDRAADFAAEQAALLLKAGHDVFSPVVHSHWVATAAPEGTFDLTDGDFWLERDAPFMRASRGLIFLKAPSWEKSSGMLRELVWFVEQGKPVVFMEPGKVPSLDHDTWHYRRGPGVNLPWLDRRP